MEGNNLNIEYLPTGTLHRELYYWVDWNHVQLFEPHKGKITVFEYRQDFTVGGWEEVYDWYATENGYLKIVLLCAYY